MIGNVTKLMSIIEEFRKMDAEMQMQTAMAFLVVAKNEGCTVKELGDRLGLSGAAASRNVAALSDIHRKGRSGHKVIVAKIDLDDRRVRKLHLTPKGRAVLNTLAAQIG